MDIGVAFEPAVIFRLMSVEIVEDDMDLAVPMFGDDPVHEVEELEPAPPFIMPSRDFAARHVEGRKQRGGSVPLTYTGGFAPSTHAHWPVWDSLGVAPGPVS